MDIVDVGEVLTAAPKDHTVERNVLVKRALLSVKEKAKNKISRNQLFFTATVYLMILLDLVLWE